MAADTHRGDGDQHGREVNIHHDDECEGLEVSTHHDDVCEGLEVNIHRDDDGGPGSLE